MDADEIVGLIRMLLRADGKIIRISSRSPECRGVREVARGGQERS